MVQLLWHHLCLQWSLWLLGPKIESLLQCLDMVVGQCALLQGLVHVHQCLGTGFVVSQTWPGLAQSLGVGKLFQPSLDTFHHGSDTQIGESVGKLSGPKVSIHEVDWKHESLARACTQVRVSASTTEQECGKHWVLHGESMQKRIMQEALGAQVMVSCACCCDIV